MKNHIKGCIRGELACNFTISYTPPWVFFKIFKCCKWYQIAQSIRFFKLVIFSFLQSFFWDCSVMKMTGNCIYKEHKITKSRATSFCQKQQKNSWKWLWLKNLSYVVQEHLDQKTTYYPKKKKKKYHLFAQSQQ